MSQIIKTLVLDSTIANASEIELETQALQGVAEVRSIHVHHEDELPNWCEETDAIIIWHQVKLTAHTLERLRRCQIIVRNGVGFDNVDIKAAGAKGIAVCNVTDYGTEEVADHSIALALARNLIPYYRQTHALGWDWKIGEQRMRRFREQTFGIVGLGRIGTAVALRAKALGYQVLFYDPYLSLGVEKSLGISRAWSLDELLRRSDLVSLHCPLTKETREMLGEDEFAKMKEGALLINTARDGIINQSDLRDALRSSKIAAAALDVLETEPPNDPELLGMANVLATPHAAFYSRESFRECRVSSALLVRRFFEEGVLLNLVNGEYYQK